MAKQLNIELKNHCSYHPQSAGLIEKFNFTTKLRLRKAIEDTKRSWVDCVTLVEMHMRITPNSTGLTPFEIVTGRRFRLPLTDSIEAVERTESEYTLVDWMLKMFKTSKVVSANKLPQAPSSVSPQVSALQPGDWVLLKSLKRGKWHSPRWTGPFRVLLATPTAIKIAERSTWVHQSHAKKVSPHTSDSSSPLPAVPESTGGTEARPHRRSGTD